jgi:hypothetical protein
LIRHFENRPTNDNGGTTSTLLAPNRFFSGSRIVLILGIYYVIQGLEFDWPVTVTVTATCHGEDIKEFETGRNVTVGGTITSNLQCRRL